MDVLQNDLLDIFNTLVNFSESTLRSGREKPIQVRYDTTSGELEFSQPGKVARVRLLTYYCLALEDLIKPSYLLPEDYDYMMAALQRLILGGKLMQEHTCISPENFGFDVYSINFSDFRKGPELLESCRFVSGSGWLFRTWVKFRYRLK